MSNLKLSIIIPVYNVKEYLKKCLGNILSSKSKLYEVILVDDGSTDGSSQLCDKYKNLFEVVKVIHKKNGGLSSARNAGIKVAKGKYILFIDSDDVVIENFVDNILTVFKLNPEFDIYMYKFQKFTQKINPIRNDDTTNRLVDKDKAMFLLTTDEIGNYAWNKIYRRSLLKNIKYPVGKNYEDIYTTYKIFNQAESFYLINKSFYFYRQRDGSIMHELNSSKDFNSLKDSINARIQQQAFFKKYNFQRAFEASKKGLIDNYLMFVFKTEKYSEIKDEFYKSGKNYIANYVPNIKRDGFKLYLKVHLYQSFPSIYLKLMIIKYSI